jgi:protoporphyrin/coproporphyrin ferrochelatase
MSSPGVQYPIGVLVMAYGGPNSLEELPGYLSDIRSGRTTSPEVLEEIWHNYSQIGGKSPLLEFTQQQVAAVQASLGTEHFRCYLGMRHWAPWIEEVVRTMVGDGITHAISIVLAPHYSGLSVAKYQAKIADGLDMFHGQIEFRHVESYHNAPLLIAAFAERVESALQQWPAEQRGQVHVVFSAHSLPSRILKMGDPYDKQLRETAQLIADRAGLRSEQWSWSYQSAGRSPEPWLGPQLQEHLPVLAAQGIRDVISVPVGFVSDHVEILYDIDIQAQEVANGLKMRLVRPPALNNDPRFIAVLAEQVVTKAEEWLSYSPATHPEVTTSQVSRS